ncbi:hypothetical protein R1TS_35080 [Enterobacter cloacae]|nr:hypothetical protein R1TS_35080 [Enterobacter cloacae]HCR1883903.1 hypothetical protein [Enterobacter roggenkampii]
MSNDITPLAQRLKAAALKAKSEANEWGYDTDAFHDEATPDAVIQVVEALEARDKQIAELEKTRKSWSDLADDIEQQRKSWADTAVAMGNLADEKDKLIAELESRTVTVKLPTTRFWAGMIECYEKADVITAIREAGGEISND